MRTIVTAALIYSLGLSSSFAGVAEDVKALGALAMGSAAAQSSGKNAKEIFVNFAQAEFGSEEEINFKEYEQIDSTDEYVGMTSYESAKKMSGFAEGFLEEEMENVDDEAEVTRIKAEIYDLNKGWIPLINKLHKAGAAFAYSGYGPGYCGVSFTQMHVIDPKTKKVYTIYLSNGGTC